MLKIVNSWAGQFIPLSPDPSRAGQSPRGSETLSACGVTEPRCPERSSLMASRD